MQSQTGKDIPACNQATPEQTISMHGNSKDCSDYETSTEQQEWKQKANVLTVIASPYALMKAIKFQRYISAHSQLVPLWTMQPNCNSGGGNKVIRTPACHEYFIFSHRSILLATGYEDSHVARD